MMSLKEIEASITRAIVQSDSVEDKRLALKRELEKYKLHTLNWDKFSFFENGTYTRNVVIHNDVFTILILCWDKGYKSVIHDHPCDGCFIVGIDGEVEEIKFSQNTKEKNLVEIEKNVIKKGDISWMHDYLGFHQVGNWSKERSRTLHVYHPSFNSCKVYNLNGETWTSTSKLYSIKGEKIVEKNDTTLPFL